jgi:hypothetical protein
MTVEEISKLVADLAATRPEAGVGRFDREETADPLLCALFTRWAELDPRGMVAALEAPAFRYAQGTRQFAVSAWAELRGLAAVEAVAKQWPGIAHRAAWELLRRHPEQTETLIPWLGGKPEWWIPYHDEKAIEESMGPERYVQLRLAMTGQDAAPGITLSKSDPDFRNKYEALPPGKWRDSLAPAYAELLVKENPHTALAWARSIPAGRVRGRALREIAFGLADPDTPGDNTRRYAEAWLADHSSDWPQDSWDDVPVYTCFRAWCAKDPKTAEAWFQTLTNLDLRATLAPVLLSAPGHSFSIIPSSERALAYAAAVLFPGEEFRPADRYPDPASPDSVPQEWVHLAWLTAASGSIITDETWAAASMDDRRFLSAGILKSWAHGTSPEGAAEFFDAVAPEARSLETWYEGAKAKISLDPKEASQWMESLPPGPERDAAVTALVEYLTGSKEAANIAMYRSRFGDLGAIGDAEAAFTWAANMNGVTERTRYMARAATRWAVEDASAARAAVLAANLPEADRQSLLRQLPEGGTQ